MDESTLKKRKDGFVASEAGSYHARLQQYFSGGRADCILIQDDTPEELQHAVNWGVSVGYLACDQKMTELARSSQSASNVASSRLVLRRTPRGEVALDSEMPIRYRYALNGQPLIDKSYDPPPALPPIQTFSDAEMVEEMVRRGYEVVFTGVEG